MGASIGAGRFYGWRRLTEVLTEIALAVAVVVFSGSVRAASDHDAISEAARSTRVAFSLFLIVSVVGGLSASWLLPLALGGDFVSEAALFRIILAGTLCGSVWAILFPSLSAVAPPSLAIRIFAPGVALGLALSVGLYHAAGVVGVSWAYLATNALLSVAILLTLRSRFAIPVHAFLVLRRNDAIDIVEGVASCFSDRVRKRVRLGHS